MAGTVLPQIWNLDSSMIGARAVPAPSPHPACRTLKRPSQRTSSPTTRWPCPACRARL